MASLDQIQTGLVSTVIPVYNRPDYIRRAVKSVLEQTYRPIEIIVVDDGSTDGTSAVLQELQQDNSELVVLRQANSGPGAARELGRRKCRGEYMQYLDSDDELLPEKFALQVGALQASPESGVAYGKTALLEVGQKVASARPLKRTGEQIHSMFPAFLRSRWWSTATPLFRTRVLELAGSWLPLSTEEDWEYDCRVASLGTKLTYVDSFVAIINRHSDHLSNEGTIDKTKLQHRCIARQAIYQSALAFNEKASAEDMITAEDWQFFAKAVFLLSRECALQGLTEQAAQMFSLSIKANGQKAWQHRIFQMLVSTLGWQNAAQLVRLVGR